jgi:hypothetical protein
MSKSDEVFIEAVSKKKDAKNRKKTNLGGAEIICYHSYTRVVKGRIQSYRRAVTKEQVIKYCKPLKLLIKRLESSMWLTHKHEVMLFVSRIREQDTRYSAFIKIFLPQKTLHVPLLHFNKNSPPTMRDIERHVLCTLKRR